MPVAGAENEQDLTTGERDVLLVEMKSAMVVGFWYCLSLDFGSALSSSMGKSHGWLDSKLRAAIATWTTVPRPDQSAPHPAHSWSHCRCSAYVGFINLRPSYGNWALHTKVDAGSWSQVWPA